MDNKRTIADDKECLDRSRMFWRVQSNAARQIQSSCSSASQEGAWTFFIMPNLQERQVIVFDFMKGPDEIVKSLA